MSQRPLRFYESICLPSNINFMLSLECSALVPEHIKTAFRMIKKRHPYFRMKIKRNNNGSAEFIEMISKEELETVFLERFEVTSEKEFENWEARLIAIGSKPHDSSQSTFYLELCSFNKTRHQLFACVNHSGIDGPGVFQAIRDFSFYLDSVLSENNLAVESKQFLDIHESYVHNFNLDELRKEPIIENFMSPVEAMDKENTSNPFISSKFYQFDEHVTKSLIEMCKKNNTTIQAALSTAVMVALMNSKRNVEDKTKFVNSCPCNMRSYLKDVCADDMICGSAALTWQQEVYKEDNLWNIVRDNTEKIKNCVNLNDGLKWWVKLVNSIKSQGYSIMSSSMGVISIDKPKNFEFKDLRFMGSAYEMVPNVAGIMTHAFTFLDRFTFNFSYTYPALNNQWAEIFSENINQVLLHFLNDESEKMNLKNLLETLRRH
ncbi:unnamed protein product [Brachionus calyciflorus]|uniref:Condensation domain-containing protein n=1 Tax=Brachionus calyciflorus TaxID=104777 RepID=A0A813MCV9_9BILA|nr:unnamed protein product [Brachionus calyciflorus]